MKSTVIILLCVMYLYLIILSFLLYESDNKIKENENIKNLYKRFYDLKQQPTKRKIPCEKRYHNLSDAIEDNRDCVKNYNFYSEIEIDTSNKEFPVKYIVR